MPVEDHPIHEATRQGPDARYGCNNLPRRVGGESYPFWNRETGQYDHISDRGSIKCQYDLSATDTKCSGCPHK